MKVILTQVDWEKRILLLQQ